MKKRKKLVNVTIWALFFVFFLSMPVFAQESYEPVLFNPQDTAEEALADFNERYGMDQKELEITTGIGKADFGQADWHYTWIGAPDFEQEGAQGRSWQPGGYHSRTGGGSYFTANIHLPSGSVVGRTSLYFYDGSATEIIQLVVLRLRSDHPTNVDLLYIMDTSAVDGYGIVYYDPGFTFDNYHQYRIEIYMPITTSSHRFKGVRIAYKRQISSPPATNTFWDVPPWHGFFRDVEALASSGITTGIGGGAYGPDQLLTRGQMAAFLARGLGLHHPEPHF